VIGLFQDENEISYILLALNILGNILEHMNLQIVENFIAS